MLQSLFIKNIAVIEKNEIEFGDGLNVLTGEAGAGKSLVIDCINIALGERSDRDLIRYGENEASVSACFDFVADDIRTEHDIDGDQLIINRKLDINGRSVCRVNGAPTALGEVRDIGAGLINIHGQRDSQRFLKAAAHLEYLDGYGKTQEEMQEYTKLYEKCRLLEEEIEQLKKSAQDKERRLDTLNFYIGEIRAAAIFEGEEEEFKKVREKLKNSDKIREAAARSRELLKGEGGAYDLIADATELLKRAGDPDLFDVAAGLEDTLEVVSEAARTARNAAEEIDLGQQSIDGVEERLDLIRRMKKKYGETVAEINVFCENCEQEAEMLTFSDKQAEKLERELKIATEQMEKAATALGDKRRVAAKSIEKKVEQELIGLEMGNTHFEVGFKETGYTQKGKETAEFLIAQVKGEPPKPMTKIASGGEMSRICLALKSVLSAEDNVPTLIFDEIDSGVSGIAAQRIAAKLKKLAQSKQVICITHLSQIAAAADVHFSVRKTECDGVTGTLTERLTETRRIDEIARIIGGENPTASAREEAAAQLRAYKNG